MNSLVIYLRNAILGGQITGSQLETLMANPAYKGAWTVAVNMRSVMRFLAQTPTAWPIIKASMTACRIMAMSALAMTEIAANPAASAAFNLQRQIFTASGTWTKPATLLGLAVVCVGGGGGGGTNSSNNNTSGGGGAELQANILDASAVSSNVTVTVGAGGAAQTAGGASSFGAFLTALGGTAGAANANGSASSGAPSVGRFWPLLPFYSLNWDPKTAPWATPCNVQGQPGTGSSNTPTSVLTADGLAIGLSGGDSARGTGYCAGGGGRGAVAGAGTSAVANTGCGGGGGGSGSTAAAGLGGSGFVVVYWMS